MGGVIRDRGRRLVSGRGKAEREERLVKALRDNLRRRKGLPSDAAKRPRKLDPADDAGRPVEPKRPA